MSAPKDMPSEQVKRQYVAPSPIALLEGMRKGGKTWNELASRYGVTNPDPPWKTSLYATCECLAVGGALDSLSRRHAEDRLAETTYHNVPEPERQLLSLAHTILSRGLLSEEDLRRRMNAVRARLQVA